MALDDVLVQISVLFDDGWVLINFLLVSLVLQVGFAPKVLAK